MKLRTRLTILWFNHKLATLLTIFGFIIVILLVVIFIVSASPNDGSGGDDSRSFDDSLKLDQEALSSVEEFGISSYLPIISLSPSYQITYNLSKDPEGSYQFALVLNAYSASARGPMLSRLLTEDFGAFDPLSYKIEFENYYNPFTNYTIDNLTANHLPPNITPSSSYAFGDSPYTVQTYTHTLYDGSTNTYRVVFKNGAPTSLPQLLFTYEDLPFLDHDTIKSINLLN